MQFPVEDPIGKVRPGLGAQTGMDFPDEGLTENVSRSGR